jgi:hypothetical protein
MVPLVFWFCPGLLSLLDPAPAVVVGHHGWETKEAEGGAGRAPLRRGARGGRAGAWREEVCGLAL